MIISDKVYQNILEHLTEGVYYVDSDRRITYWNKAAEQITGYTRDEVVGRSCADNILRHIDENGVELCIGQCPLSDAVANGETHEQNIYLHHKEGHRVHVFTRVSPIYDDSNKVVGAVELFTDLSKNTHGELICELEKLKKEVYTDALTKIGNRKYAEIMLERKISDFKEQRIPFSIFFIDIDHFKSVNDTYGHDIGDKVLKMVANSIVSMLRSMDIICRWGGEEFVIISPNISGSSMESVAERVRQFIEKSWVTTENGEDVYVTLSIGGTSVRQKDNELSVVKRADLAMYKSKLAGRNTVTII